MGLGKKRGAFGACSWQKKLKGLGSLLGGRYVVDPALTPSQQEENFALRHKIYCEELGYEPQNKRQVERDLFDPHSVHLVLRDRQARAAVGCVRLVMAGDGKNFRLPMEDTCGEALDQSVMARLRDEGRKYVEISRLGLLNHARCRGENWGLYALYLTLYEVARYHDVKTILAIVEVPLMRQLQRLNLPMLQIGDAVEHRGKRVPIMMDIEAAYQHAPFYIKIMLWMIRHRIDAAYRTYDAAQARMAAVFDSSEWSVPEQILFGHPEAIPVRR